jgi:membrane protein YdbS with pleckstrin-like domain
MSTVPLTSSVLLIPVVALLLVVAILTVFLVPSLRARRWLVWTVLGASCVAALGALIWTYTI